MRSASRILFLAGALALVALLAWRTSAALRSRQAASGPAGRNAVAALVQTARAERATLVQRAIHIGEVTATSSVDVTARVAGVVAEVVVEEGQTVRRGELLARLDPKDLRFQAADARAAYETQRVQVEAARAALRTQQARLAQVLAGPPAEQLRQAEEQVRQARAALEFSREQLRRTEELFAQGYVSRVQLDSARLDLTVQEARLRGAEEQLALLRREPRPESVRIARAQVAEADVAYRQARARLEEARVALQRAESLLADSRITAPVDGVIGRRMVERGQAVTPATPLFRLIDVDPAVITMPVIERDLTRVAVGIPVTVRTEALPGAVFSGRVASISPILSPTTRTAEVRVEVPNADGRLRPGMFVNVEIQLARRENVVAVPLDALLERPAGSVVFVVQDGTARERVVRPGISDGARVEIISGLSAGETVAVAGHRTLRDGAPVTVQGSGRNGVGPAVPGAGGRPGPSNDRGRRRQP
ncbi:MAG: efflux RND transporter periplasmic adaptor subunit [Armatimonadota bacterium]|nr:efflux RND transporter periplasmic adaptor subunit [Armatimonadota bacterium]MDR7450874.1 efflux RND transporter periplasmic adaptor subunit [Armatimonadota bacterium]MDR7465796.1 efflux RND transporter periplasmic adaptor subunit [Armatimonadota bacterium]MDR7493704.1 efflux RND transporter periplasmic adaptor subunit [Armatimonadota bacterium]MDR7500574.1 efflux RND transporter periplasmic adaptor subunit [Armatimonadota bacterium]